MKQRYLVNIQNVDNLDNITIEVAPFIIFTGDNNSGKSTIMNIIYGIFRLSKKIISKRDLFSHEYEVCRKFIQELKENREGYIDNFIGDMFCNLFNRCFDLNKDEFFKEIFDVSLENNYERFKNTKLFLSRYKIFPKVLIIIDDICDEILIEGDLLRIPYKFLDNEEYMVEFMCNKIIEDGFSDTESSIPTFLPSGRGTFLCYPELFSNLKYQNLSIKDFLINIKNLNFSEDNIYSNIVNFIEDNIVKGKFTRDSFKSYLNNIEIPISMESDFIRELASFVLSLKSKKRVSSFFIEEIETHLNLKIQRSIVSALVRIVNSGTMVFMSTNSSVILDQLCNFILLNNLNRDKIYGFGYIINDVLDVDKINIYEFTHDENKVLVNKLPIDYNGFNVDFNDIVLNEISKENLQLKVQMSENNLK